MTIEGDKPNRTERADNVLAEVLRQAHSGEKQSLKEIIEEHPDLEPELRAGYTEWVEFGRKLRVESETAQKFRASSEPELEFELPEIAQDFQGAEPSESRTSFRGMGKFAVALATLIVLALLILRAFDTSAEAYVLYAVRGGGQIEADPLYMGPERNSVDLTFRGRDGVDLVGTSLRVVSEEDGLELPDFKAVWTRADGIGITTTATAHYQRRRVRLEALEGGSSFDPFTLVMLGADAWQLTDLGFGEQPVDRTDEAPIVLDPSEVELSAWVVGEGRDDIERLAVRSSYSAERQMTPRERGDESNRYGYSISRLQLKPGATELIFEIRDKAGRESRRVLPIEIVPDPLLIDIAGVFRQSEEGEWISAARSASGIVLAPEEEPILRVETRRPSDLKWQLFVAESDQPSATGESLNRRIHEEELVTAFATLGPEVVGGRLDYSVDEDQYILRSSASTRGRRKASIAFSRSAGRANFRASLATLEGAQPLVSGAVAFSKGDETMLVLEGRSEVSARFFVFFDDPDGNRIPLEPETVSPGEQVEIPLPLFQLGTYALSVQSFLLDPGSSEPVDRPDEIQDYRLVVDDRAPELMLNGERSIWTKSDEDLPLTFDALVRYEGAGDVKVQSLACQIFDGDEVAKDVEPPAGAEHQKRRWEIEGNSPFLIEVSRESVDRDGLFMLQVTGRDLAGNELEAARIGFEVSRRGPRLELVTPAGTLEASAGAADAAVWRPDGSGLWTLQLDVRDPNGIALVEGALISGDRELGIVLTKSDELASSKYIGRVELDSAWSNAHATLRLSALDRYANETVLEFEELLVSEIRGPIYSRLSGKLGALALTAMRRIEGNHDYAYVFGGRGDAIENELFEAAGLAPLNPESEGTVALSFGDSLGAGSIDDFYLDEYEVSNADFLAFVLAPTGFSSRENWTGGGGAPSQSRSAKLLVRVREAEPNHPVHGVTWQEANAYASWVGKRLPTWREWEFAVRGGKRYRPMASWDPELSNERAQPIDGIHARAEGLDQALDSGVFALCSNLSEWTATACPDQSGHYWIAGGSHVSGVQDFAVVDDRPNSWSGVTVGFRCAQSAHVIESAVNQTASPNRPAWTGLDEDIVQKSTPLELP